MSTTPHTDREYEQQLTSLREQILLMGARVEGMITSSIRALTDRNSGLAKDVIDGDRRVDRLEIEVDHLCLTILARRQPVASDLRFLTTALKIVTDLERIADLGVNICERTIELNAEPQLKPYIDLPKMADVVQSMIRETLDAFVAHDADRAHAVLEKDHIVDAYYGQVFRELLTYMMADPKTINRAIKIQAIAKYLERMGDHATNLAEMVVFMLRGKDIRHLGSLTTIDGLPHGVLFLCTHNAARSQMAEAWAKKLFPVGVRIWSAGSQPGDQVDPNAVSVMRELGIDMSGARPKGVSEIPIGDVDTIVTLCAEESCPFVPGELSRESWGLPDPAAASGSEEEVVQTFRRVRDDIRQKIDAFMQGWMKV
ncbi:MAG: phosphate transport system regulatory protein PhoU [Deltaproteobacteria bacterium RIFOXYA12_FULL_58_15]|nr:MAG: phosphate transport system regulatory protein PhoU [Deltaproteobacteria bacterium RIFOXYA12_FULL_58_15]OGR09028.1 MAG: phosphate transport system regulatory protein PhoU [Deltaproteobacteria bacterium RIFOXYB12_FULL_58_9]